jgi:hypothetical protein
MASPLASATSAVDWSILPVSLKNLIVPIARLEVPLFLGTPPPAPHSPWDLCWLDSGAPLSVVPFHVQHQRLAWQPIPGIRTTWAGQPCDLGRIDVWLQTEQPPTREAPFRCWPNFLKAIRPATSYPYCLDWNFS